MRPLVLGLALTFLATCVGSPDRTHELNIQKLSDGARSGTPASRNDSGAGSVPSSTEAAAIHRMENAIAAAERMLHGEEILDEERETLLQSLEGARAALRQYRSARLDKAARAATVGMIGVAAAAIVADDATVVGVADDPLLVPLALAAMVAGIRSNAPSARDNLARAWLELGHQLDVLRNTIALTSRGNVIHNHLVDEARERAIRRAAAMGVALTDSHVTQEMLCDELERMMREFRRSKNMEEWKKAVSTQKGLKCRPSRHSRE